LGVKLGTRSSEVRRQEMLWPHRKGSDPEGIGLRDPPPGPPQLRHRNARAGCRFREWPKRYASAGGCAHERWPRAELQNRKAQTTIRPMPNRPSPSRTRLRLLPAPSPDREGPAAADSPAEWVDRAMEGPPSVGPLGRMELLRHWNRLPAEKRRLLLLLARGMSQGERE
jgi:hypothetical protein